MSYDINRYIEIRLEEWSDWYKHYEYCLGYPTMAFEWMVLKNGGVQTKSFLPGQSPINPNAEEIESFVSELSKQNALLALVLREQYFGIGNVHHKARRIKISYPNFRQKLEMAKQWMAGRLSCKFCWKHEW